MKRNSIRLCSLSLALILLLSCVVPAAFASSPSVSSEITGFWESLVNSFNQSVTGSGPLSFLAKYVISSLASDVCAQSEDGHHHGNLTGKTYHLAAVEYEAKCTACGEYFRVSEDTVSAAYNEYVSTLPSSGVSSAGRLLWSPNWDDFYVGYGYFYSGRTPRIQFSWLDSPSGVHGDFGRYSTSGKYISFDFSYQSTTVWHIGFDSTNCYVPVSGYYRLVSSDYLVANVLDKDDSLVTAEYHWTAKDFGSISKGSALRLTYAETDGVEYGVVFSLRGGNVVMKAPVFSIIPADQTVVLRLFYHPAPVGVKAPFPSPLAQNKNRCRTRTARATP